MFFHHFASFQNLEKTISEISELLQRHRDSDDSDTLRSLCDKAQVLAMSVRSHYRQSDFADHKADLCHLLWEMGYSFHWADNDIAAITLPLLLPRRGGDVDFITKPLSELLSLDTKRKRFKERTIVYEHLYDNRKKSG